MRWLQLLSTGIMILVLCIPPDVFGLFTGANGVAWPNKENHASVFYPVSPLKPIRNVVQH